MCTHARTHGRMNGDPGENVSEPTESSRPRNKSHKKDCADACVHVCIRISPERQFLSPCAKRRSEVSSLPLSIVDFDMVCTIPPTRSYQAGGRSLPFPSFLIPCSIIYPVCSFILSYPFPLVYPPRHLLLHSSLHPSISSMTHHLTCLNHPLAAAMVTDLSMTHSPTSR